MGLTAETALNWWSQHIFIFNGLIIKAEPWILAIVLFRVRSLNKGANVLCYSFDFKQIISLAIYCSILRPWYDFSTLLSLCEGNPPANSCFSHKGPVMWSFYVTFDVSLNNLLKKWHCRWFEMPQRLCDFTVISCGSEISISVCLFFVCFFMWQTTQ